MPGGLFVFVIPPLLIAVYCIAQIYRDVVRGSYGWATFGVFALLFLYYLASI